jgi:general secretion pathway protein H
VLRQGRNLFVRTAGGWPARMIGGFTLIEILVVVLLIAITATLVTVNLQPRPDKRAKLEADRFAALVGQAREESILQGRAIAVEVDAKGDGYRFLAQGNDGWKLIEKDDLLRPRKVPEPLSIRIKLPSQTDTANDKIICQIDGSVSTFDVTIGTKQLGYIVSVDESQKITVKPTARAPD